MPGMAWYWSAGAWNKTKRKTPWRWDSFGTYKNSCWETAAMLTLEMMLPGRCMRCIDIDSRASFFRLLIWFQISHVDVFCVFASVELWPQRGIIAIYIIRWLLALPSFGQSFRSATRRRGAQFRRESRWYNEGFRIVSVRETFYTIVGCAFQLVEL